MKRLILAVASACLLALSATAYPGPPGTEQGSTVEAALVCEVPDLSDESKDLLNTWIELNEKAQAGTLTEEEYIMGALLYQTGQCSVIRGGIEGTVVLLDGHDYLVDYCVPSYPCVRVIQKSSGFERQ